MLTWKIQVTDSLPAISKLANILYSKELQRRLDVDDIAITVIAVHPGGVGTFYHRLPFQRLFKWLLGFFFLTPDEGAYSAAFAAASPDVRADPLKYKGKFLCPVGILTEVSKQADDLALAKELWQTTESFLESIDV
jgi:NAD(P)-dependent dehydrogenase (short-subunit alcohol dehydrogenase family)